MTIQSITTGIISVIKAPIILVHTMWDFLLTPLFTLDLTFLNGTIAEWLLDLLTAIDFTFGVYDITLLFVMTATGVTLFLVLKIINLLPLV